MDKKIDVLRTFFRVSNAAFNFTNAVVIATGGAVTPCEMQLLHKLALEEIEKEQPDMAVIDSLLAKMEQSAEINKAKSN